MKNIKNVSGGKGGCALLLIGKDKTALIDAGMAYCAHELIRNCQEAIGRRPLDYIIISHSHYDHIGAIPYIREVWPASKVLGAEYAKRVLAKSSVRKTIRELSEQAAEIYGSGKLAPYKDEFVAVDQVIAEGDLIKLGGIEIKVIETPGHTQCSLAFLVNDCILFASESTGCLTRSGRLVPAFIRSCSDAMYSVRKCQKLAPKYIVSPHYGLVSERDKPVYWAKCLKSIQTVRTFILDLANRGFTEEQILAQYDAAFRDEAVRMEQPFRAFELNTTAMIKFVLQESVKADLEFGHDEQIPV